MKVESRGGGAELRCGSARRRIEKKMTKGVGMWGPHISCLKD